MLINLTEMTINRVRKRRVLAKQFKVERGLRQGDQLSSLLFNQVLERCIRKIEINPGGNIYNLSLIHI